MKQELEMLIVKKYPMIYKDYGGDMRYTCMHWGFSHGDGWFKIIDNLSRELVKISEKYDITVVADQVKEKFGGLRFYYHIEHINDGFPWYSKLINPLRNYMFSKRLGVQYWALVKMRKKFWRTPDEKIEDIVSKAEELSYKICEGCGKSGNRSVGGGWITTLCDNCKNKKYGPVD